MEEVTSLDASRKAASKDSSAVSLSRKPFSMPKHSADDRQSVVISQGRNNQKQKQKDDDDSSPRKKELAWNELGLWIELVESCKKEFQHEQPSAVQRMVIPELLASTKATAGTTEQEQQQQHQAEQSLCFCASTGSGKTLAYTLPLMQLLKQEEVFTHVDENNNNNRPFEARPGRPRLIILAPTRELVLQITAVVKKLSHNIKLSSCSLIKTADGGYGKQRKQLKERPVDIVVASPGTLLKHWKEGNLFLSQLQYVVLDEMDTMLEQGFQKQLRELLYPVLYHKKADQTIDLEEDYQAATAPRLVLTSATVTQAIQKMIGASDPIRSNNQNNSVQAVRLYKNKKQQQEEWSEKMGSNNKGKKNSKQPKQPLVLPPMKVLKAAGLHKTVPRLQQVFVDVGNTDKMSLLIDLLSSSKHQGSQLGLTMVFSNTAQACRAVQFALQEGGIPTLAYHGELNSAVRAENLKLFRQAGQKISGGEDEDATIPRVLVCTDLAARGLDIPEIDHVVMFDFPLNAADYLHRAGRTARGLEEDATRSAGRKGRVTALVTKRDRVLANAIEQAVVSGQSIAGLSSRKSDYTPGGRLSGIGSSSSRQANKRKKGMPFNKTRKGIRNISRSKKKP